MAASQAALTMMQFTATNTEKKTLLFGGTFDPFHKGHIYILQKAIELTDCQRIIIMPACISNFKEDSRPASGEDRYKMISLALEDFVPSRDVELVLSDYEITKGGVSYSYNTVKHIIESVRIKGKLGFLMGDDLLPTLEAWYRFDDLKELVTFVCFTREKAALPQDCQADIIFYNVEPYVASSTDVRGGEGKELPAKVAAYIESHGLYYAGKDCKGE